MTKRRTNSRFCRAIGLAEDRVVPDVLLDGVGQIVTHATLSSTRKRALRARGFRAHSASPAVTGRRVRTWKRSSFGREAPKRVFHRAILERVKRDHGQPPVRARAGPPRRSRNDRRPSISSFIQIRSAWNVRVAGSIRCQPRPPAARRTTRGQRRRIRQRPSVARRDDRARDPARVTFVAEPEDHVGQRPPHPRPASRSAERRDRSTRSSRMSSGPACRKLNPRSTASSSCIDDTPRSATMPSTSAQRPRSSQHRRQPAVVGVHERHPSPSSRPRRPRRLEGRPIAIEARSRVPHQPRGAPRVWPPRPSVAST